MFIKFSSKLQIKNESEGSVINKRFYVLG